MMKSLDRIEKEIILAFGIMIVVVFAMLTLTVGFQPHERYRETVVIEAISINSGRDQFLCNSTIESDWITIYFSDSIAINLNVNSTVELEWINKSLYGSGFLPLGWQLNKIILWK